MFSETEYRSFDDDLPCHEVDGETVDEIADAFAREYAPGPSNVEEQESEDEAEIVEEPKEPKVSIKAAQDLADVLESLERVCCETDSPNVPLMSQLRNVFCRGTAIKQKRLKQSNLDLYLSQ